MIPPKTDPRWSKLVKGELQASFKNLALKIMITKLKTDNALSKSEATLAATIQQAYDYLDKNKDAAKDDIKTIFG